jgi:DNA-binding GntR family transcriptional regulator
VSAPLKHRTLSAMIADQLRQSILDGTHPAGAQLRKDALGEAYGPNAWVIANRFRLNVNALH